jgi:hypothetical protein
MNTTAQQLDNCVDYVEHMVTDGVVYKTPRTCVCVCVRAL